MALKTVKSGDRVVRLVAGVLRQELAVTEVDDRFIYCGAWKFDRETGGEVDEDLGWDGRSRTGSILKPLPRKETP